MPITLPMLLAGIIFMMLAACSPQPAPVTVAKQAASDPMVVFQDTPRDQLAKLTIESRENSPSAYKISALLGTKALLEATITYKGLAKQIRLEKADLTLGGVQFELFAPRGAHVAASLSIVDATTSNLIRKGTGEITLSNANMALQLALQEFATTPEAGKATARPIDASKPAPTDFDAGGLLEEVAYPAATSTPTPAATPTPETGGGSGVPLDEIATVLQISLSQLGVTQQDLSKWAVLQEKVMAYYKNNAAYVGVLTTGEVENNTLKVMAFYPDRGATRVNGIISAGTHAAAYIDPLRFADIITNVAGSQGCLTGIPLMSWSASGTDYRHEFLCLKNSYTPYGTLPYTYAMIDAQDIGGLKGDFTELMKALSPLARYRNSLLYVPVSITTAGPTTFYKTISIMASTRQRQSFHPTLTNEALGQLILGNNYNGVSQAYRAQNTSTDTCLNGQHPGTDYPAQRGSAVMTPVDAKVSSLNDASGTLVLEWTLNPNRRLMFLHLDDFNNLQVGAIVSKGAVIGHVGLKGFSTGPHVHLEVSNGRNSPVCYFQSDNDAKDHLDPKNLMQ